MRAVAQVVIVLTALVLAAPVGAQPRPGGGGGGGGGGTPSGVITFVNHEVLANIFNSAGIKSSVDKLKDGGLIVRMQIWPNTYSAAVPIFCKKDGTECGGFQLFVNLGNTNVNDAWIKAWNRHYFFVRTYKLDNGEQIFLLEDITQGGVTPQNIAFSVAVFKQIVEESTDFKP
jgi:hypothetical protein